VKEGNNETLPAKGRQERHGGLSDGPFWRALCGKGEGGYEKGRKGSETVRGMNAQVSGFSNRTPAEKAGKGRERRYSRARKWSVP